MSHLHDIAIGPPPQRLDGGNVILGKLEHDPLHVILGVPREDLILTIRLLEPGLTALE